MRRSGKGYVGATHLKITDHSWHDERTMTPIFPVIRVVGRVSIECAECEYPLTGPSLVSVREERCGNFIRFFLEKSQSLRYFCFRHERLSI